MSRLQLLLIAASALLAATACSPSADRAVPQMEHIHGIGVDGGAVYVGTHHGLFRIKDGKATFVGDSEQDFMGFAVAGPGHFLASGHPGPGQGGPGNLGLIESTDGGETWTTRSLTGDADFHALDYRHKSAFGVTGGQLMVSSDLESWKTRSGRPIGDLAVSPASPDVIVASTLNGLARSVDGGRTYSWLKSAPPMAFISWGTDGYLAGVTPAGVIYTANNSDGEWTKRANLGQPEALTVESAEEIYIATGGDILLSTDGGATFKSITRS
jgi:photosystem II stability/assembly factor-like uncharacterized protein